MGIGNLIIGSRIRTRQTTTSIARFGSGMLASALLILGACSSESITEGGSGPGGNAAPAPVVASLLPASAVVGTATLTLTVRGERFVARSQVLFGDAPRPTTFISATELRATVTAADLASVGVVPVTVRTAGPGGGTAVARQFTIHRAGEPEPGPGPSPAPAPVIAELSPSRITAGWPGTFTVIVKGEHFTVTSRVLWNGMAKETHYISATELRFTVDPADVALPAENVIAVETPAPGGGSAQTTFPVLLRTPARVDVTSATGTWLWVSDTMTLEAVARDLAGNVIPHWTFDWSSVREEIASVNAAGRVTGVTPARTQIRATAGEVTGLFYVAVHEAPDFDLVYDVGTNDERRIVLWTPGSGRQPITLTPSGINFDPSPSPDGRRIAFTAIVDDNRDIWVFDRDGAGTVQLTSSTASDDEAAWSPDGSRIAFRSTRSGMAEVWVMNTDGSDQRKLTGPDEGWYLNRESFAPAWSPSSQQIAYVQREDGDADIWIMNADGTGKRRLTSGASHDSDPVWSADGEIVTFRRTMGTQVIFVSVAAANGMPVYTTVQPTYGRVPSYSPDGKWFAYSQLGAEPASALMVMPAGGSDWPRIARASSIGGGNNPQWIRRP